MRVGNLQPTRPLPYDRNGLEQGFVYSASGVAPHANTQRWAYTVPNNRKPNLCYIGVNIIRQTVAAAAGTVDVHQDYKGAGTSTIEMPQVFYLGNGLNDERRVDLTYNWSGLPGDGLKLFTSDSSTGGTMLYNCQTLLLEFDN